MSLKKIDDDFDDDFLDDEDEDDKVVKKQKKSKKKKEVKPKKSKSRLFSRKEPKGQKKKSKKVIKDSSGQKMDVIDMSAKHHTGFKEFSKEDLNKALHPDSHTTIIKKEAIQEVTKFSLDKVKFRDIFLDDIRQAEGKSLDNANMIETVKDTNNSIPVLDINKFESIKEIDLGISSLYKTKMDDISSDFIEEKIVENVQDNKSSNERTKSIANNIEKIRSSSRRRSPNTEVKSY